VLCPTTAKKVNETPDLPDNDLMIEPATAGGAAHDGTGPNAAAHVSGSHDAAHVSGSHDSAVANASGGHAVHDEHEDRPPGPIDWAAWRATLLGIAVGVVICLLLYLAIR
jgi:hypothetical protein